MNRFSPADHKLSIGSIEPESLDLAIVAQYNPKELPVSKPVPWHGDKPMAPEYGGPQGRDLTVELFLDCYEKRGDDTVNKSLAVLDQLSSPRKPNSSIEAERRPHRCVITWGKQLRIDCVITSVDTKFLMWGSDGQPLRAVATVKVKEIDTAAMAKAEGVRMRRQAAQPGMRRVS